MISIVLAMSENRVIGRRGRLPWHLPEDLKRFKRLTTGHHVIMGRRTFESIGRPLPDRTTVVISRRRDDRPKGVTVACSLEEAIERCGADPEIFVIGGAEIYRLAWSVADRIYLTLVRAHVEGDVLVEEIDLTGWRLVGEEHHAADERHPFAFDFLTYERTPSTIIPAPDS